MRFSLLSFFCFCSSVALSAERPKMTSAAEETAPPQRIKVSDNSDDLAIADLVKSVAGAVESESVDAYQRCFKQSDRPSVRRKVAFFFVEGRASMEILDIHVIDVSAESASAAVRYKMGCSSSPVEFLSEVRFLKEDGNWVIDREIVKSKRQPQAASYASAPNDPAPIRQAGARWDPMNPNVDLMSPNLEHLVGDIGIREGKGCSGGNCPNGRCFVK